MITSILKWVTERLSTFGRRNGFRINHSMNFFTRLYRLCRRNNASIQKIIASSSSNLSCDWCFNFNKKLNDNEISRLSEMKWVLGQVFTDETNDDRCVWNLVSSRNYGCMIILSSNSFWFGRLKSNISFNFSLGFWLLVE